MGFGSRELFRVYSGGRAMMWLGQLRAPTAGLRKYTGNGVAETAESSHCRPLGMV